MLPPPTTHEPVVVHVPPPEQHPTLLTVQAFYEALGKSVGINAIRAAVKSGRIKSVQIGRKRLIPRSELVDWIGREVDGLS